MTSTEPQPAAPPPSPRFQFSLRTLLLLIVLLASSLGAFGAWGIANFALVVGLAIFFRRAKTIVPLAYAAAGMLCLMCLLGPLSALRSSSEMDADGENRDYVHVVAQALQSGLKLPNIAAVAVWLISAGIALTWAVRSREAVSALPDTGYSSGPNDRALSRSAYRTSLIVHGLASLTLLALLVTYFVGVEPKFREIIEKFDEAGQLGGILWFAARVSPYLLRLLPLALAVDAAVLYMLSRLPQSQRWFEDVWFSLVFVGVFILDVLVTLGILSFALGGSTSVG